MSSKKAVKKSAKKQFGSLPNKNLNLFSLILAGINLALILLLNSYLPPVVPFFYGEASGENQLTTSLGLMIGPLSSFFVIGVNTMLALMTNDNFSKRLLIGGAFLYTLLMFITIVKIFLLVGFF